MEQNLGPGWFFGDDLDIGALGFMSLAKRTERLYIYIPSAMQLYTNETAWEERWES